MWEEDREEGREEGGRGTHWMLSTPGFCMPWGCGSWCV